MQQTSSALAPDALSPAQITAKAESVAITKAATPMSRVFVLALLAGSFISFGALFFTLVASDAQLSFALKRLIGGVCFSLGLVLVLCCGAELFTGNTLMVTAALNKKITWRKMIQNWVVVWLGNLVGALVAVFLVYMASVASMNAGEVGNAMVSIAASKTSPDWITLFFKGILCNIFVCLAVWIGYAGRTIVDKVIGIVLPITAFVACGFEHCVANMFFLPTGLLMHSVGFGASVDATSLTIGAILMNLSAATLGNIIGGAVFVGMAYWFVFGRSHTKG